MGNPCVHQGRSGFPCVNRLQKSHLLQEPTLCTSTARGLMGVGGYPRGCWGAEEACRRRGCSMGVVGVRGCLSECS